MKTLLLAESHAPTLEHLRALLSQAGYAVRAVSEPWQVVEHCAVEPPDLVVVAADLPRLEGMHVCQVVRQYGRGARTPVLVVDKGQLGRTLERSEVLKLQANGYVPNPLHPGELLGKVEALAEAAARQQPPPLKGVQAMMERPPVASGSLEGFPLLALVHSLYRQGQQGVLVVATRSQVRHVYFSRGVAARYESNLPAESFTEYLHQRQVLTATQAQQLSEALGSGLRIGAALAEAGVEASGDVLLQLLRDYTRERVAWLLGRRKGRYAFYAGEDFHTSVALAEIPALAPLLDAARSHIPLKVLAAPLHPFLSEFPVRTPQFGQDLTALALGTDDLKIAMQVNGRLALRDLLAHGRGDLRRGYTLLAVLNLAGGVEFSPVPLTGGVAEPDVIAPRRKKPLPADVATVMRESALRIITASYFVCLGLDITADTETVEKAYLELAARYHPDSYPEYDIAELQDLLDSVQERLLAAYRVLSVEEKRQAYLQYLVSRMELPRTAPVEVEAERLIRQGQKAVERGEWAAAINDFKEALKRQPHEPEYYVYLAWARYRGSPGPLIDRARAAQRVLGQALTLDPERERALVVSAIIDIDLGDTPTARKKLLKVLERNPNSRLAQAALRKVGE